MEKGLEKYIGFIKDFISNSDISSVSPLQIRMAIQESFAVDLLPVKSQLKALIKDIYHQMLFSQDQTIPDHSLTDIKHEIEIKRESEVKHENETKRESEVKHENKSNVKIDSLERHEIDADLKTQFDADFALATALSQSSRVTRQKKTPSKPIKKSPKSTPRKKSSNGFTKPLMLSKDLKAVVNEIIKLNNLTNSEIYPECTEEIITKLPRTIAVKLLWQHIKLNNLQDEKDGRVIVCDDAMKKVFGKRVGMFKMNKILATHLKPDHDTDHSQIDETVNDSEDQDD